MGRTSTKMNKTIYQLAREKCGMTREEASDALVCISKERIERIESRKNPALPEDVLRMSEVYKDATLCNRHCATECQIGMKYIAPITLKELSQIVLEILASLKDAEQQRDRLIDITVDGKIAKDELRDFVHIEAQLDKISLTVDALKLWVQTMLMSDKIDAEEYKKVTREQRK